MRLAPLGPVFPAARAKIEVEENTFLCIIYSANLMRSTAYTNTLSDTQHVNTHTHITHTHSGPDRLSVAQ